MVEPIRGQFQLNRANLASIYLYLNNINHYVCTPIGTVELELISVLLGYAILFDCQGTNSFLLKGINNVENCELLNYINKIFLLLPDYIRNQESKEEFPIYRNTVHALDEFKTQKVTEHAGRGSTYTIQIFNNFEYQNYIEHFIETAGPLDAFIRQQAGDTKARCCKIFISTPSNRENTKSLVKSIINNAFKWNDKCYDLTKGCLIKMINQKYELLCGNPVYIEYSAVDLTKDASWCEETCTRLKYNLDDISRKVF